MRPFNRILTQVLSLVFLCVSFGQSQAAMIANGQVIHQIQQVNEQVNDKVALIQAINRTDVQEQLLSMGVTITDIESRVSQMTPEEITQLNQQIDELPAGGGALGIILIVFIVFVITDVIGATDIFPFIHPIKK